MLFAIDICNVQNLAEAIYTIDAIKDCENKCISAFLITTLVWKTGSVTPPTSEMHGTI